MHKILKRFLATVTLACFPLVFSACGGGGGSTEMTTISGTAVKGPIKGALVQVFTLKENGTKGELLGSGISDGSASYTISIPKASTVAPLLVTVSGQNGATYRSEATGGDVPFTVGTFSAAIDRFDSNKTYTVTPLTDAAFQQLQKFMTDNPSAIVDSRVVSATNARVATLFNVNDILADPLLSNDAAYATALKIIDQMVKDSGESNTLQTMNLISQAFADVDVKSPAYQNYLSALVLAASKVDDDPAVAAVVNAIVAAAYNPPAPPILTDITPPKAVTNLIAVSGAETATTGSVALTWKASTTAGANQIVGYDVYRDGVKIATVSATGYVDKPLALATAYTYFVVTFDAAGNRSLSSAKVTATTPQAPNLTITVGGQLSTGLTSLPFKDITAPAAPLNVAASTTAINATTSSVKLTWSAATDNVAVTGYDVYRGTIKLGTVSTTTYTDLSVTSGVASSYTVIAFDAEGNRSAASVALSVTPIAPNLGVTVSGQLSSSITGL